MERITEILEDKTEPKSRYRFIKLSNGEDIACEMETDSQSGYIMVKDPHENNTCHGPGWSRYFRLLALDTFQQPALHCHQQNGNRHHYTFK